MGMAITYAAVGVVAGFSGTLLSNALQTPWALGGFALIFVLLALSMFGLYELQLPAALQGRLTDTSNRLHGGHLSGVFVMGALSAIIVGPCVAAPLAGALLYIGQTHDAFLGGSALFSMALGLGVPLLLIGASAGTLLPKAGAWMESVKRFFGVLLLAVAIWIIAPIIPVATQLLMWATLLIISAIYLRALDALPLIHTTAPSSLTFSGEVAVSRPNANQAGQADVEPFEGAQGSRAISLNEQSFQLGSLPGSGRGLPAADLNAAGGFDSTGAVPLVWQNGGSIGNQAVTSPDDISKRVKQAKAEGRNSVLALIATQNGERFVALKLDNA